MAKERKSPQQKKQLEYTRDHFSGGFNSAREFRKGWKRKKAGVNRQYRRKSDELLASVKPGSEAGEAEAVSEDMTALRFQKSVSRKRLNKIGVISMGERVKRRLQNRAEAVGRKVWEHQYYDQVATQAVRTLASLSGEKLLTAVERMRLLLKGNVDELTKMSCSVDPLDQALRFLRLVNVGSGRELDALQRNPDLFRDLHRWIAEPNRIIAKEKRARERKQREKEAARQRQKAIRRTSPGGHGA